MCCGEGQRLGESCYGEGQRLGESCYSGPHVLDAHFIWPDGVAVSLLARRFGLPYVITLRGKIYPCLEVPAQRRQCAEALRGAAAVISVDARMAEIARELGAAPDRVSVIPNGVDLDRFRPADRQEARRRLGLPEQGRLLVTVAHLGVRKGHREAIAALARLPDDVRLLLVGDELRRGDAARLRRLATSLGIGHRLMLVGSRPPDRVGDYFAAADAGLLASYREGCPNAVLECLACGRPIVATDVGAVPDIIEPRRNGKIVPLHDTEALAVALNGVLNRSWDAGEVRRGVKSWDEVAQEVEKVLEDCCEVTKAKRHVGEAS
ncbi:MAG: glycosyltransferase [Thermoguttaceae bacterium]